MKILHLSTFSDEGGASKAATRLHYGLLDSGQDSWLCVHKAQRKHQNLFTAKNSTHLNKIINSFRPHVDALPLKFIVNKQNTPWSIGWLSNNLTNSINKVQPDVIHAHWINAGYLSLSDLSGFPGKLIWTLHDSWPFTGGCHVMGSCDAYKKACGKCPQLGSETNNDLSKIGFNRKKSFYKKNAPIFIAPSNWMAEQARASKLLSEALIKVIPNGLNTDLFSPTDKSHARFQLKLPQNKKIILFGAMSSTSNPNKGFEKLKESLSYLTQTTLKDSIHIAIFGANEPVERLELGFPVTYLGEFFDEISLATVYSAADIICVPSIQESFCQVASEAMSCGLPVVAYATSGLLDVVKHNETGYLARPYDTKEFSHGIEKILNSQVMISSMSASSRKRVMELFDIKIVSAKHLDLYRS